MPTKTSKLLITACAAVAFSVLGAAASHASALIISHNGTAGSNPAGTDEVNVSLNCDLDGSTETCTKTFFDNVQHEIIWNSRVESALVETVVNESGTPWTDFHWEWEDLVLSFAPSIGVSCDGGGGLTCASTILTANTLDVFFNEPFSPDGSPVAAGTDALQVTFFFEAGFGGLIQYPTFDVPEPGTLALFGLGLAGLGFARRKKAA
jgi:hypothetical protein